MNIHRAFIRVLVADSNQTQSQLLSSALRRQQHMKVVCCGGEPAHCLEALRSIPADIVILGNDVLDHNRVIDTIRVLHSSYPQVGIVLLLDNYDRHVVVNAMRAGARGLFCRAAQPFRALCRCISVVYQGQFWANTEQIGFIVDALNSNLPSRLMNAGGERLLTEREVQVVNFVAEGLANREIGQSLNIKENSVKKALLRIYDKLGVSNRVEVVLWALSHLPDSSNGKRPAEIPIPLKPSATLGSNALGGMDNDTARGKMRIFPGS